MRSASVCILFCLVMFCPNHAPSASADTAKPTPLILEKNESERRVWRPIEGVEGWLGHYLRNAAVAPSSVARSLVMPSAIAPVRRMSRHSGSG